MYISFDIPTVTVDVKTKLIIRIFIVQNDRLCFVREIYTTDTNNFPTSNVIYG